MAGLITRRGILQGIATAPVLTAPALIPSIAASAPVAAADPIFARYVAFLAHEHRAALIAMHRDMYARNAEFNPAPPMFWLPEDHDVQTMIQKRNEPERRARAVLHAVGLPIPPQSWF